MNKKNRIIVKQLAKAVLFLVLQVLAFDKVYLYNVPIPFFYLIFLLDLPYKIPSHWLLLIGFAYGLSLDVLENTLGLFAASCVFMVWIRLVFLKYYLSAKEFDSGAYPNNQTLGIPIYLLYLFCMIFAHQLFIILIEVFLFTGVWFFIGKLLLNTLTTLLVVFGFNQIFRRK